MIRIDMPSGAIETETFSVDEPAAVRGDAMAAEVIDAMEVGSGEALARAQAISNASGSIAAVATMVDAACEDRREAKRNYYSTDPAARLRSAVHLTTVGARTVPQKRLGVERCCTSDESGA